jgi:RNA polymerase sigma-70 factor (ECF subfamily)
MGTAQVKTQEQGLSIHRLLVAGDPTAPRDLIRLYLDPLIDWLKRRFPSTPADLCQQAVNEALVNLCQQPGTFDPECDPDLFRYLCRSARGDLLNALRLEKRRRKKEILVAVVELDPVEGNEEREDDPVHRLLAREERRQIDDLFAHLEQSLPEADRPVLRLFLVGETHTEAFAQVLKLADRPVAEQRQVVKRAKDRVLKHVQREGRRYAQSTGFDFAAHRGRPLLSGLCAGLLRPEPEAG